MDKHPRQMTLAELDSLPTTDHLAQAPFAYRDADGVAWRVGLLADRWRRAPKTTFPETQRMSA